MMFVAKMMPRHENCWGGRKTTTTRVLAFEQRKSKAELIREGIELIKQKYGKRQDQQKNKPRQRMTQEDY